MMLECLTIAQAQIGEELYKGGVYYTLQTDGTTKHGQHFSNFDMPTGEEMFCRGLHKQLLIIIKNS